MTVIQRTSIKLGNRVTRRLPLTVLRATYGFLFSICAPLGWIIVQIAANRDPFSTQHFDGLVFAYMTIGAACSFSLIGFLIGAREETITNLALTDGLTGLYNKRYFQTRLEQEFERFQRYHTPMSLIQLDLDHFKEVNDTWGHQAGDAVLKSISQTILSGLRTGEIAARVGGEEICIIVCNSQADSALILAERLRETIATQSIPWNGSELKVSASFGIAEANQNTLTLWQLYEHADKALYLAKQHGRNRSEVFA